MTKPAADLNKENEVKRIVNGIQGNAIGKPTENVSSSVLRKESNEVRMQHDKKTWAEQAQEEE